MILVDYRGAFWSSVANGATLTTMDCRALQEALASLGVPSQVVGFSDVDFRKDWRGVPVVYTSSEDPHLSYKSYIEDVVLALERRGAILLPRFDLLRAHHNKVFMELLRKVILPGDPLCETQTFGVLEEYSRIGRPPHPPVFVKGAAGAGSAKVRFAGDQRSAATAVRQISHTGRGPGAIRSAAKTLLRPGFVPHSAHRGKFIVQRAVPGLKGDFKVLRYGHRYYAMYRHNRHGTYLASGGGLWDFNVSNWIDPSELMAFARDVSHQIDSPFLSLDIASSDHGLRLLEFQAVCFGSSALQRGTHQFVETDAGFLSRPNDLSLEEVFAEAVGATLAKGCDHVCG